MAWTPDDTSRRAWEIYQQGRLQRARLFRSYEETLHHVRIVQMEATHTVEPVARKLWEINERMRGDMNPDWPQS